MEAVAAYRKCDAVISAELGAEPSAEIQELGRRLGAAGGPRQAPVRKARSRAASPLLGRERKLATVQGWWRAAADGAPHWFGLVAGEAGIGKTRLVAELAAAVGAAGGRQAMGTGRGQVVDGLARMRPPELADLCSARHWHRSAKGRK